jgi:hypothetical protein
MRGFEIIAKIERAGKLEINLTNYSE